MIAAQFRREFAVRSLLWWIPISTLLGGFIHLVGRAQPPAPLPLSEPLPAQAGLNAATVFLWLAYSIFLLNSGFASRCSSALDLGLPIPARRLWLVHISAILLAAVAMSVVLLGMLTLGTWWTTGTQLTGHPGQGIVLRIVSALPLALMILQSPAPALSEIPLRGRYGWLTTLTTAGFLGVVLVANRLALVWSILPIAAAAILGWRTYKRLPLALAIVTRLPRVSCSSRGLRRTRVFRTGQRPGGLRLLWLTFSTIWRNPFGNWTWLYLPILLFHGVMLTLCLQVSRWQPQLLFLLLFTFIVLCCWALVAVTRLHVVDPWPIARFWVLAAFVVPAISTIPVAYVPTSFWVLQTQPVRPPVELVAEADHLCIRVPTEFYAVRWNPAEKERLRDTAEITHSCCPSEVFRGGPTIYDPFCLPPDAPRALVATQLSRAVESVYGLIISPETISNRYLGAGVNGAPLAFALPDDEVALKSVHRYWALPGVLLVVGLPWLVFVSLVARFNRAGIGERRSRAVLASVFVVVLAGSVALLPLHIGGVLDAEAISLLLRILLRRGGNALPGGPITAWLLCVACLTGAYLIAQAQFRQMEIPVRRNPG